MRILAFLRHAGTLLTLCSACMPSTHSQRRSVSMDAIAIAINAQIEPHAAPAVVIDSQSIRMIGLTAHDGRELMARLPVHAVLGNRDGPAICRNIPKPKCQRIAVSRYRVENEELVIETIATMIDACGEQGGLSYFRIDGKKVVYLRSEDGDYGSCGR